MKQVVLITGTSRGLGLLMAQSFLSAGYIVIGCSRDKFSIDSEAYFHYALDISNEISVGEMFSDMRKRQFIPRILINNAAVTQAGLTVFTKASIARSILDVNLVGSFLITREAVKLMQRNKFGRVINITSINVPLASAGGALYNASKSGLETLGRTIASEFNSFDLTVNNLGLSLVDGTTMVALLDDKAKQAKRIHLLKSDNISIDEIMAAINFFASPEAKNITGQTLYFGGVW
jgi:3-oxoacyl-[acyl-carrier protein] reductase